MSSPGAGVDPSAEELSVASAWRDRLQAWGGRARAHELTADPVGFDPGLVGELTPVLAGGSATAAALVAAELGRVPVPGPWVLGAVMPAVLGAAETATVWADAAEVVVADDGGLHGTALLVPSGEWADRLLVPVGSGRVAAVDASGPYVAARLADTVGADRCVTFTFTGAVSVDVDPAVPVAEARDRAALVLAAELVGVAEAALDVAVARVSDRHVFGRPVGSYQAIQHRLADDHIAVTNARLAVLDAAGATDLGRPWTPGSGPWSAALLAADAALSATASAHQVHGGEGYHADRDPGLLFRRARALAPRLGGRRTWSELVPTES